ncbi:SDR family oxidoreductase [Nocardia lijiangensis]|uniref:SDR family oxidoreductase n=1 Tax=Nocardia lijiangensis TaxID=299618 RepID=UPI0008301E3B|nr:NAD(P)H-binding protein [Nocardia lijiangensis]
MIVVTGATGNIGRSLVPLLAAAGAPVTAVSRGVGDVALPEGVRHVAADLADPASLSPALAGAEALFLLITGEQLMAGPDPEEVLGVAADAGVRRVVFVSSLGTQTRPEAAGYDRIRAYENVIRASSLEWTLLRPGGFFSNTYAWVESVRTENTVAAPFGSVGLPSVDPADIAAVAAAALREDGHAGRIYTLTGPALSTPREQAAALGAALGTEVRFIDLSPAQAREGMLRFMPEAVADHTLEILGAPTPGELLISPDIEKVLGRPAGTYAQWAERNRAVFA